MVDPNALSQEGQDALELRQALVLLAQAVHGVAEDRSDKLFLVIGGEIQVCELGGQVLALPLGKGKDDARIELLVHDELNDFENVLLIPSPLLLPQEVPSSLPKVLILGS